MILKHVAICFACKIKFMSRILKQFPDLANPSIHNKIMKHDTVHVIETKGQPIHAKARRLRPEVYE
ncbi:hypothetical protein TNCV_1990811 [Trichonephila clavipes]|nr:hypothetical protein TNCV_1990811 [Trichonephila clavipes]